MKLQTWIAAAACAAWCAGASAQADKPVLKDLAKPGTKEKAPAAGQPSEAEMKAWMEASTPGENHKRLDPFVGEWNVKMTTQMAPDAPKEETTGQMTNKWVLDGRFLLQEYTGTMMGMPFNGLGTWGYDNVKKEYIGSWMDTSSTGAMNSTGQYDAATKAWTMKGSFLEPSGKAIPTRQVIKIVDPNTHTFEFYMPGPDGKEFKSMMLTYTRKTAARPTQDTPAKK